MPIQDMQAAEKLISICAHLTAPNWKSRAEIGAGMISEIIALAKAAQGPQVGDGATRYSGSDRYAYTVVSVSKSGKRINVQADKATRTDGNGISESQQYEFTSDPSAAIVTLVRRKDGSWYNGNVGRFSVGTRSAYYDYSF